jgi:hypothetical protein
MPTEIAKIENYAALDREIGSSMDEPLRFKDGKFIRGFDKMKVDLGTRFLMHPASTSDGFIKWEDGKPVEFKIRELNNPSQLPVFREPLGDLDESKWPDGKDPWASVMMIAMKDQEGVMLTFSTSSVGGRNALRKVLRDWRLVRDKHYGQVPVIELGVDSYKHKIHRTTVEFPVFKIVDWATWDGPEAPALPSPSQRIREELDDDLPDWSKSAA